MKQAIRIGIDVGGTHTKAVAIDNSSHRLIGKSSVKTTHDSPYGVADGVFQSFQKCLEEHSLDVEDVVFVAHSTTQATNSLLEGDVAKLALITGSQKGISSYLIRKQGNIRSIPLTKEKQIEVLPSYIAEKDFNKSNIQALIQESKAQGAEVLVISSAFAVDDSSFEDFVASYAKEAGIYYCKASELSKMYGFSRRTKTALVNASIMPKMLQAIDQTEKRIKDMGIEVPLMLMRGDGGIMDVKEVRKRPVQTMLSGPAASVMGSMMYLQASNGLYFEVGGTSTNIGVIKNGRPAIDYASVGNLKTFVSSLDVKVLGIGGGSMLRASKKGLIDVGPRSAHIAGMDYACFTDVHEIEGAEVFFFQPKENDPKDYVGLRLKNGKKITITNTCAANALALVKEEHFAYGDRKAARAAIEILAREINWTVDELALAMLDCSFHKIEKVINYFSDKYRLKKENMRLVGVGGGAASLIIHTSEKLNLEWEIPEHAEVISSIGVALAMVQDIVERLIPNPSKEDLAKIREEAVQKALDSGASKDSIEVHIDIDSQTQKVRAIASGSTEVRTQDTSRTFELEEAQAIAKKEMGSSPQVLYATEHHYIFSSMIDEKHLCVIDYKGFNRIQSKDAVAVEASHFDYKEKVEALWEQQSNYQADIVLRPSFYLMIGAKFCDFRSESFEQLCMLMDLEVGSYQGPVLILAVS